MNHKEIKLYKGKYKGIPYEIANAGHWTLYLFLVEDQMPDVFDKLWLPGEKYNLGGPDHIMYKYYENDIITSLDWHCGCTYYSKVSGFDGDTRVVKVGCDYNHHYDEGISYSLPSIEQDVQDCIESLLRQVKILQWCGYCGKYFDQVNERGWCSGCQEEHGNVTA